MRATRRNSAVIAQRKDLSPSAGDATATPSSRSATPQWTGAVSPPSHQNSAVYFPGLLLFLLIAVFCALIIHASALGLLKKLNKGNLSAQSSPTESQASSQAFPGSSYPRLQITPREDWKHYLAAQENELNSFGWIDRKAGTIRIPIGRAMEYILSNGLPAAFRQPTNLSSIQLQQLRATKGGTP